MTVKRHPDLVSEKKDKMQWDRWFASTFESIFPTCSDLHFLLDICYDLYDFQLVFNADETMIQVSECNDKSKVVTYTAVEKHNINVINGPRNDTLTLPFTGCADGTIIPPVVTCCELFVDFDVKFFYRSFFFTTVGDCP
jgi:hypothetical protein